MSQAAKRQEKKKQDGKFLCHKINKDSHTDGLPFSGKKKTTASLLDPISSGPPVEGRVLRDFPTRWRSSLYLCSGLLGSCTDISPSCNLLKSTTSLCPITTLALFHKTLMEKMETVRNVHWPGSNARRLCCLKPRSFIAVCVVHRKPLHVLIDITTPVSDPKETKKHTKKTRLNKLIVYFFRMVGYFQAEIYHKINISSFV